MYNHSFECTTGMKRLFKVPNYILIKTVPVSGKALGPIVYNNTKGPFCNWLYEVHII